MLAGRQRSQVAWVEGAVLCACLSALAGCAERAVVLRNLSGQGEQWVWPYFLHGQPTALAFWNTNEMQCLRDVPALRTLEAREGSVQLVSVVTGKDRMEIDKWRARERIGYVILLDLEEELTRRLGVNAYPCYLYFDAEGKELDRVYDVRTVHNWFDRQRWLERSGAVAPAVAPPPR